MSYQNVDNSIDCIQFLDDALFFEQHIGRKLFSQSQPRETTLPLFEVRHAECHNWLEAQFLDWFSHCANIPTHDLAELKTCLSEVFNNIQDHTAFDVGSIFAQWYPNKKKLLVAIADFGVGIPATVGYVCDNLSDGEAIDKAFEDGFSAKSTPQNRGVGLYYLKQIVVENLGGTLKVFSAGGVKEYKKNGSLLRNVQYVREGYCPGTLIELEFNTDSIVVTGGEREDLGW